VSRVDGSAVQLAVQMVSNLVADSVGRKVACSDCDLAEHLVAETVVYLALQMVALKVAVKVVNLVILSAAYLDKTLVVNLVGKTGSTKVEQ
jgi:hypothetical protein